MIDLNWPVLLLVAVGVGVVMQAVRERGPERGTVEHAKQLYLDGEIDRGELERRVDVLQDPEAERIRAAVERVNGIGEQTSFDVAAEFRSLEALRDADRERLEEVPNIGPERARAIQEYV
jgi:ERCC4-type nuclease